MHCRGRHGNHGRKEDSAALGGDGSAGEGGTASHGRGCGADARELQPLRGHGPPLCPRGVSLLMNAIEDSRVMTPSHGDISLSAPSDRRADIDAKQAWATRLAHEVGCEGLLV